jgi:hypothetical protein
VVLDFLLPSFRREKIHDYEKMASAYTCISDPRARGRKLTEKSDNRRAWIDCLKFNVNTFRGDLQLSALGNLDRLDGLVRLGLDLLDLLDDVEALEDLTEDDVTAIEPPVVC